MNEPDTDESKKGLKRSLVQEDSADSDDEGEHVLDSSQTDESRTLAQVTKRTFISKAQAQTDDLDDDQDTRIINETRPTLSSSSRGQTSNSNIQNQNKPVNRRLSNHHHNHSNNFYIPPYNRSFNNTNHGNHGNNGNNKSNDSGLDYGLGYGASSTNSALGSSTILPQSFNNNPFNSDVNTLFLGP